MASYNIDNAPQELGMVDFRSISDDFGGLAKNCRFAVVIRPIGTLIRPYNDFARDLTYLCEIAEFPGRGFLNVDLRYYGPNFKLPFQSQYEDISLTFLCRAESFERQFFDDWMLFINPINTFDFNYRDDYISEIDIYQYSEVAGDEEVGEDFYNPQYYMTMHNAYPLLVNPQAVTWADDQIQRLTVSFTYTHWSRRNYDPVPRPDYQMTPLPRTLTTR
jgi:hypothetical protein